MPLPDGWSEDPQPETAAPGQSPLPAGWSEGPADTPPTVWQGSVLPVSRDALGKLHFDPSAGILGSLGSAATLPYDVFTGRQPILGPNGQPDPSLVDRTINMATLATPMGAASRAGAMTPGALFRTVAPSADALKAAAGAGYDAARASGLDISGDAVGQMARDTQQSLTTDRGIIAKTAPKTFAILDELASPPSGAVATVPGIDAARRGLTSISLEPGTEGLAARDAVHRIDSFLGSLDPSSVAGGTANPQDVATTLSNARANYAAAQRSNSLTGDLDRATTGIVEQAENRAHASHSGRNIDNAIRQRVASFLQNPQNVAGYSQPEIDALNGVVRGGPVQNTSRFVGNLLGGGGGLGSLLTMGAGAYAGSHMGPEGAAIGAMVGPTLGTSAKTLENALARRSLNGVDNMIRLRSPLADQMRQQGLLYQPYGLGNMLPTRLFGQGLLNAQPQAPQTGLLAPGGALAPPPQPIPPATPGYI